MFITHSRRDMISSRKEKHWQKQNGDCDKKMIPGKTAIFSNILSELTFVFILANYDSFSPNLYKSLFIYWIVG